MQSTASVPRLLLIVSGVFLGLVAVPVSANEPAFRFEQNIVGDELSCPEKTYTVQSGAIQGVVHEGESASGNTNFTVTLTPRDVVMTDEQGNTYSLRGAIWFGGATTDKKGNQLITATHNLEIVARGSGVVDSIRLVERLRNDVLVAFDFGSCEP